MPEILIDRPGWLDWSWALSVLDQEVRLPGEEVRADDGLIATPCLLSSKGDDRPVAVTVRSSGPGLAVTPARPALAAWVTRRFHLDLDTEAVGAALARTGLFDTEGPVRWVRRPAAAGLWPFCLAYLCGGDPDAAPVRRLLADLGRPAGTLRLLPEPADLLTAGAGRLAGYGLAAHRVAHVLGLAQAFAANPDRYDEAVLLGLPAGQAVARIAKLPHIGATRARLICAVALGHDDVLPDLSRRGEQLHRALGVSWSRLTDMAREAAPYRSLLGDTLTELIAD